MTGERITSYRVQILPGFRFVRRPASIPPTSAAMCLIDRGSASRADRYVPATYADGQWRTVGGVEFTTPPTYWTEMVPDD